MDSSELAEILKQHAIWIKTDARKGSKANLEGANLQEANLMGANLQGANLEGADLEEADLREAKLEGARLEEADLRGAKLDSAYLKGAKLQSAYLKGANFWEADLQEANLQGANLMLVRLTRANLLGADLQGANLEDTIFHGANLSKANLQGANLSKANLKGADLQETNLQLTNLQEANLMGANLQGANLQGANLQEANLRRTNLIQANLIKTNIIGTIFDKAVLDGVNFKKAKFIEVSLQKISIKDAILESITIDQNSISQIPKDLQEKYSKTWFVIDNIQEEYDENYIIRSIEFPAEYHQAGISILNYFGSILREKYPEKKAKIKIEQEELKVTLIIETSTGDREIIEKSLDDYGLVFIGQMAPEKFLNNNSLSILRLENQLGLVKHQLEMERKIGKMRELNVSRLFSLLQNGIFQKENIPSVNISPTFTLPNIDASSNASPVNNNQLSQNTKIDFHSQITYMQSGLNELLEELPKGSEEQNDIKSIQKSLEGIEKYQSADKIKKSSAMSKIRRFLEDLGQEDSKMGMAIKGVKGGVKIVQDIAGYYNGIAELCGLPFRVPKPFLKKIFDD